MSSSSRVWLQRKCAPKIFIASSSRLLNCIITLWISAPWMRETNEERNVSLINPAGAACGFSQETQKMRNNHTSWDSDPFWLISELCILLANAQYLEYHCLDRNGNGNCCSKIVLAFTIFWNFTRHWNSVCTISRTSQPTNDVAQACFCHTLVMFKSMQFIQWTEAEILTETSNTSIWEPLMSPKSNIPQMPIVLCLNLFVYCLWMIRMRISMQIPPSWDVLNSCLPTRIQSTWHVFHLCFHTRHQQISLDFPISHWFQFDGGR